jgi:hypothetical protein
MGGSECDRKPPWPTLGYFFSIFFKDLREITSKIGIACFRPEIQTEQKL